MSVSVSRGLTPDEVGEVRSLLDAARFPGGERPLSDALDIDLRQFASGHGGSLDGTWRLYECDPAGTPGPLLAYAQTGRGNDVVTVEAVVVPTDDAGRRTLLSTVLAAVVADRRDHTPLHWWAHHGGTAEHEVAAALGFRHDRTLLQMRRRLPIPDDEPTVETRPFVPGRDESEWIAVNNRAFATHLEQGGWDLARLRGRYDEPWFDPRGFLLHHDRDGHLDGFCWTKVHADLEPPVGEIYVIGVDPSAGGQGLGRALTMAGLRSMTERGLTESMLYVDGANNAATRMYHRLGFDEHHRDIAFVLT